MADREFSTLEAVNPQYRVLRGGEDEGKQVLLGDGGMEVRGGDGIEVTSTSTSNLEYAPAINGFHEPNVYGTQTRRWRRRWLLLGAAILLLVIIGAIVGGILGTKNHNTPLPLSTQGHKIAALAFQSSNSDNARIYYRANSGKLREAAKNGSSAWVFSDLGKLEKECALAGAVSRPGFPLVCVVILLIPFLDFFFGWEVDG